MDHAAVTGAELIAVGALGVFLISCLVTYQHATTGAWDTCVVRNGGQLFGSVCHRRYFGVIIGSLLLAASLGFFIVRSHKAISRTLGKAGPSLVIETDWFWCDQLAEPVRFADVLSVREVRLRRSLSYLALIFKNPVTLNYADTLNKQQAEAQKQFNYSAFGYSDRIQLLETIAFRIRAAAA